MKPINLTAKPTNWSAKEDVVPARYTVPKETHAKFINACNKIISLMNELKRRGVYRFTDFVDEIDAQLAKISDLENSTYK